MKNEHSSKKFINLYNDYINFLNEEKTIQALAKFKNNNKLVFIDESELKDNSGVFKRVAKIATLKMELLKQLKINFETISKDYISNRTAQIFIKDELQKNEDTINESKALIEEAITGNNEEVINQILDDIDAENAFLKNSLIMLSLVEFTTC